MNDLIIKFIVIYFIIINIAGLLIFYIDKKRAIKGKYRISEKSLFTVALLGGSLGAYFSMRKFRHKTKHWYFAYGIPCIIFIQVVGIGLIIKEFT